MPRSRRHSRGRIWRNDEVTAAWLPSRSSTTSSITAISRNFRAIDPETARSVEARHGLGRVEFAVLCRWQGVDGRRGWHVVVFAAGKEKRSQHDHMGGSIYTTPVAANGASTSTRRSSTPSSKGVVRREESKLKVGWLEPPLCEDRRVGRVKRVPPRIVANVGSFHSATLLPVSPPICTIKKVTDDAAVAKNTTRRRGAFCPCGRPARPSTPRSASASPGISIPRRAALLARLCREAWLGSGRKSMVSPIWPGWVRFRTNGFAAARCGGGCEAYADRPIYVFETRQHGIPRAASI